MGYSLLTTEVPLDTDTAPPEPLELLRLWFDDAHQHGNTLPEAMALATASPTGRPSNRFVLLKGIDAKGAIFFSNYESRKGRELADTPYAAAALFWPAPRRQVRIEGRVERLSAGESDAYFDTRDRLSRIGAIVSPQSRTLENRDELDRAVSELEEQLRGADIPRPAHWGGYRILPDSVEFWAGRENRLHDRIRYQLSPDGAWLIERLAP